MRVGLVLDNGSDNVRRKERKKRFQGGFHGVDNVENGVDFIGNGEILEGGKGGEVGRQKFGCLGTEMSDWADKERWQFHYQTMNDSESPCFVLYVLEIRREQL